MDKKFILLWVVTVLGAFFAGKSLSGTKSSTNSADSSSKQDSSLQGKNAELHEKNSKLKNARKFTGRKVDPKIKALNLITDLKQLLGDGSMMVSMDFASFAESYNLVKDAEEEEIIAALDHLAANGNAMTNMYPMLLLMGRYAEIDAKSALSYYDENVKNPQLKMVMLGTIIAAWAKNDPNATYDWYIQRQKDNPDSGNQFGGDSITLTSIFQGLAKQDLQDSFKKLKDLKLDGFKAQMASYGIAGTLKVKEDYISYMTAIKDWDNAAQLRQSALQNWVFRDPNSASEWINSIEDEKERSKAGKEVLQFWLSMDSEGATDWYMNLNQDKAKATVDLLDKWAMTDPKAASAWLEKQDLKNNQAAVIKMVESAQYTNPKISAEWLNKINDEEKRKEKTADIYQSWKRTNKEKAKEFLETSPYKEEILSNEKKQNTVEDLGDFEDL